MIFVFDFSGGHKAAVRKQKLNQKFDTWQMFREREASFRRNFASHNKTF